MTSSLMSDMSPVGFTSSRAITCELSANSSCGQATPSALHSSSSILKMYTLKYCCSFSFAKLISNCSSELRAKASNPKMSSSPMVRLVSAPPAPPGFIFSLMRASIQSNREPYSALARASRATLALSGGWGTCTTGNLPTLLTVSALSSASSSISSRDATASTNGIVEDKTREPSSCAAICTASNPTLPILRTAASTLCTADTSGGPSWKTPNAEEVRAQSALSSMPET
mmetsp:Transcript_32529/g.105076  ORF Transcript_32529/g.105076 Transcript_32529/m.105076 type:complete len:229 (-) Transcript_32529:939-1625(-)